MNLREYRLVIENCNESCGIMRHTGRQYELSDPSFGNLADNRGIAELWLKFA